MRKSVRQIVIVFAFAFLVMLWQSGLQVKADEGETSFGSVSYEWELDTSNLIGIYANSEQTISEVQLYVSYDADMLEYESGGQLVEPGMVEISAKQIGATEYREMLTFIPRLGGSTRITIQASSIIDSDGEKIATQEVNVPVNVPIPEGCELEAIEINGVDVDGFDPDLTTYNVDVQPDISEAKITCLPESVETEITDTNLTVGTNVITVTTINANGERARYVLIVDREEDRISPSVNQATTIMQGNSSASHRNQTVFTAVLVILVIVLISLIILKIKIIKKKKEEERRQRKLSRQERLQRNPGEEERLFWEYINGAEPDIPEKQMVAGDKRKTVISVKNVTMEFNREKDEATSLKELVIRTIKRQRSSEKFTALNDISFDIQEGDVVGLIGTNGAGKSTMLKIISGVLMPTRGTVEADRSKVQLLTLGTGFDNELTGRENVYLNGAIIGYTKEYIDEKYHEIVKFAELEGFMEEKVRNYSTGMVSRLGFAIATIRDTPEILILDEVLSVGDMFFRKKSEKRIKEMIHGGSTVLIVSHSTDVIIKNCTKAIWIEKGNMRAVGTPKEVCKAYAQMQESDDQR